MITACVLEDDDKVRKFLVTILNDLGITVTFDCKEPDLFLESVAFHKPNVVFIDIVLEGHNGFLIAEELHQHNPDLLIVFITGNREYAAEAYDFALDYLLKPIRRERLEKCVLKIKQTLASEQPDSFGSMLEKICGPNKIAFKQGADYIFVNAEDIFLIQKDPAPKSKKTQIITSDQIIETYETLNEIENRIVSFPFLVRVHRSYIINRDKVEKLSPIGDSYLVRFKDRPDIQASIPKARIRSNT